MPNVNINIDLKKWYSIILKSVPVLAMIATAFMWVDTRYMHRDISNTRFIELQIRIVQGHIRDYTRIVDSNGVITASDTVQHEMDKDQLKNLMAERNKILGIGGLPE